MIVIVDTETTGLDHSQGHMIELAMARYDDEESCLIDCDSCLIGVSNNKTIHINGIREATMRKWSTTFDQSASSLKMAVGSARCLVAHNASFDKKWLPSNLPVPWVCSMRDIEWPAPRELIGSGSLEKLALAHGLGVLPGHRAIHDVLTLVRVFDRAAQMGAPAKMLIDRALRPASFWRSRAAFVDNAAVKAAGFTWHTGLKIWWRKVADVDVGQLDDLSFPIERLTWTELPD